MNPLPPFAWTKKRKVPKGMSQKTVEEKVVVMTMLGEYSIEVVLLFASALLAFVVVKKAESVMAVEEEPVVVVEALKIVDTVVFVVKQDFSLVAGKLQA